MNNPAASTNDILGGKSIKPLLIGLQQCWTMIPYMCTSAQHDGHRIQDGA